MTAQLYFEDLTVGDELPETTEHTTHVQLFRYSAVTWNPHRIHYDKDYAATEGYPDVLVQSHLHGAFLTRFCTEVAGPAGAVEMIDMSVRRYAVPGDVLTCRGRVTALEPDDDGRTGTVLIDVEEVRGSDGAVCAPGTARIRLPRRAAGGTK
ncbi:MaoC/PaaZ C-terminal domain-containing protein [Nocardia cyriacigeorgica]|uniref:MaoC/PaaZ C-terminal domain-containing protein n=1 Tax=Nocardia cyriacigeorgica TaxID=135487 RepID=UPI0013CFA0F4|nr:MaoC/PaaZ C-terminal domain-containing protein [Nocardia cyriacigeorgica]NEW27110.1 acyl dehydratase [Nocardia cyriacigeorgica]